MPTPSTRLKTDVEAEILFEKHCNRNHANRKWSGMTKNKNVKHTNESPWAQMETGTKKILAKQSEQVH